MALGQGYLQTLEQIEPGLTRNRGKALFEVAETKLNLILTDIEDQEYFVSKDEIKIIAKGIICILLCTPSLCALNVFP